MDREWYFCHCRIMLACLQSDSGSMGPLCSRQHRAYLEGQLDMSREHASQLPHNSRACLMCGLGQCSACSRMQQTDLCRPRKHALLRAAPPAARPLLQLGVLVLHRMHSVIKHCICCNAGAPPNSGLVRATALWLAGTCSHGATDALRKRIGTVVK